MNKPDISKILKLARKAKVLSQNESGQPSFAMREFKGACSPDKMIALLEYVQELEKRIEFYEVEVLELDDAIEEDFEEWKKEQSK